METSIFGHVPLGMKRCARCHKYKSLTEFNRHVDGEKNRQPYCRDCQRDYAREHSSCGVRAHAVPKEKRTAYDELYARYRTFRAAYDEYVRKYGDNPTDRLNLEYDLGL